MNKQIKAFVSSTFEDLKEPRAYVNRALRDAGIHVDPMGKSRKILNGIWFI